MFTLMMLTWRYLLHDGRQTPQSQPALIASGHHGAAELHHDAFGLFQLTAVGEGFPMRPWENCRGINES